MAYYPDSSESPPKRPKHIIQVLDVVKTIKGQYIPLSDVVNVFSQLPHNEDACVMKLSTDVSEYNQYDLMYVKTNDGGFHTLNTIDCFFQNRIYHMTDFGENQYIHIDVEQAILNGWLAYRTDQKPTRKKNTKSS